MVGSIVFVNLLINIMGDVFTEVNESKDAAGIIEQAKFVMDAEQAYVWGRNNYKQGYFFVSCEKEPSAPVVSKIQKCSNMLDILIKKFQKYMKKK